MFSAKKEDHRKKAQQFGKAAFLLVSERNMKPLSACRNETMLFVMHLQLLIKHLINQNKIWQFLGRLKELCENEGAPAGMYDTFVGNIFASAALGPTVLSLDSEQDRERAIGNATHVLARSGMRKDLAGRIREYAFTLSKALRGFYSTGAVERDSEELFVGYLHCCFLMVQIAAHGDTPVISAIDADYMRSCGVENAKQARYLAEIITEAVAAFFEEAS